MPKVPQYTEEQVELALRDISQGLSVRTAAKKYRIPRATLQFNLKNPEIKSTFGPEPYLTSEGEKQLEDWLCIMDRRGFPKNAEDISADEQNEELFTLKDLGVAYMRGLSLDQLSCSKTNLRDFLPVPSAPARKGKRNVERLAYQISGLEYQKILEEKSKEKQRVEEEKRTKKIERELKKAEKKRKLEEMKTKKLRNENLNLIFAAVYVKE